MTHIRNIKDMLSIQPGNRNMATSGYSSFTDSQLFFSTQFWPENSQGLSQDMSVSSRNSQQSSQEGSDPKFSTNYHAKPLLFGDFKDKVKAFDLLNKFEEDKTKAKEKTVSDNLSKELNHIREALSNLFSDTEKNSTVCQAVFEKFDQFASTVENNLISLQSDISQQFKTLLHSINSQKEITTELEERVKKEGEHKAELDSSLQILRKSLKCVSEEQEQERDMLHEALKLLNTLITEQTAKPNPERVVDKANQTSPVLDQLTSSILQDNRLEATPLTCISNNLDHNQTNVLPPNPGCIVGRRKFTLGSHRKHKKRPLVLSQRRRHPVTDENSQPLINPDKNKNVLCEQHDMNTKNNPDSLSLSNLTPRKSQKRTRAARCAITPLSCWSQDSSSSQSPAGEEHILDNHTAESRTETQVKQDRFWQLFDMGPESEVYIMKEAGTQ